MLNSLLKSFGSGYGNFFILDGILNEKSIVYSFGVGEDISFDVELTNFYKCHMHLFDPNPRAKAHFDLLIEKTHRGEKLFYNTTSYYNIDKQSLNAFTYHQLGVYNTRDTLKFYAAKNKAHDSFSVDNLQNTKDFITLPVDTLSNIMNDLGHTHIDLLKINIEGAEYAVLKNMLKDKVDVKMIALELHFDNDESKNDTIFTTIDMLFNAGYYLIHKENAECLFVRFDEIKKLRTSLECAPIVLFCYKRIKTLKKTITSLQRNVLSRYSDLFIYSDVWKNEDDKQQVEVVREYLKTISGFKSVTIIELTEKKTLRETIIAGVTEVVKKHEKIIVLEDDLLLSPFFLNYMNEGLNFYKENMQVYCINGFSYLDASNGLPIKEDVYFNYLNSSHGWATWSNRWNKNIGDIQYYIDELKDDKNIKRFNRGGLDLSPMLQLQIDNKIDAWDILWAYTISKNDGVCVNASRSYVCHLDDEPGTHIKTNMDYLTKDVLLAHNNIIFPKKIIKNQKILQKSAEIFSRKKDFVEQCKQLLKKIFVKLGIWPLLMFIRGWVKYPFRFKGITPYDYRPQIIYGTPIDRIYMDNFISKNKRYIQGIVAESMGNHYALKYGGENVKQSYIINMSNEVQENVLDIDLTCYDEVPENILDCCILTNVLNFVFDIDVACSSIYKILKPGWSGTYYLCWLGFSDKSISYE